MKMIIGAGVAVLVWLSVVIGMIWTVCHFIVKFW
jgi:hypothetical protein